MQHILKKLLTFVLTACLVFPNMPVQALAHSFLAPPSVEINLGEFAGPEELFKRRIKILEVLRENMDDLVSDAEIAGEHMEKISVQDIRGKYRAHQFPGGIPDAVEIAQTLRDARKSHTTNYKHMKIVGYCVEMVEPAARKSIWRMMQAGIADIIQRRKAEPPEPPKTHVTAFFDIDNPPPRFRTEYTPPAGTEHYIHQLVRLPEDEWFIAWPKEVEVAARNVHEEGTKKKGKSKKAEKDKFSAQINVVPGRDRITHALQRNISRWENELKTGEYIKWFGQTFPEKMSLPAVSAQPTPAAQRDQGTRTVQLSESEITVLEELIDFISEDWDSNGHVAHLDSNGHVDAGTQPTSPASSPPAELDFSQAIGVSAGVLSEEEARFIFHLSNVIYDNPADYEKPGYVRTGYLGGVNCEGLQKEIGTSLSDDQIDALIDQVNSECDISLTVVTAGYPGALSLSQVTKTIEWMEGDLYLTRTQRRQIANRLRGLLLTRQQSEIAKALYFFVARHRGVERETNAIYMFDDLASRCLQNGYDGLSKLIADDAGRAKGVISSEIAVLSRICPDLACLETSIEEVGDGKITWPKDENAGTHNLVIYLYNALKDLIFTRSTVNAQTGAGTLGLLAPVVPMSDMGSESAPCADNTSAMAQAGAGSSSGEEKGRKGVSDEQLTKDDIVILEELLGLEQWKKGNFLSFNLLQERCCGKGVNLNCEKFEGIVKRLFKICDVDPNTEARVGSIGVVWFPMKTDSKSEAIRVKIWRIIDEASADAHRSETQEFSQKDIAIIGAILTLMENEHIRGVFHVSAICRRPGFSSVKNSNVDDLVNKKLKPICPDISYERNAVIWDPIMRDTIVNILSSLIPQPSAPGHRPGLPGSPVGMEKTGLVPAVLDGGYFSERDLEIMYAIRTHIEQNRENHGWLSRYDINRLKIKNCEWNELKSVVEKVIKLNPAIGYYVEHYKIEWDGSNSRITAQLDQLISETVILERLIAIMDDLQNKKNLHHFYWTLLITQVNYRLHKLSKDFEVDTAFAKTFLAHVHNAEPDLKKYHFRTDGYIGWSTPIETLNERFNEIMKILLKRFKEGFPVYASQQTRTGAARAGGAGADVPRPKKGMNLDDDEIVIAEGLVKLLSFRYAPDGEISVKDFLREFVGEGLREGDIEFYYGRLFREYPQLRNEYNLTFNIFPPSLSWPAGGEGSPGEAKRQAIIRILQEDVLGEQTVQTGAEQASGEDTDFLQAAFNEGRIFHLMVTKIAKEGGRVLGVRVYGKIRDNSGVMHDVAGTLKIANPYASEGVFETRLRNQYLRTSKNVWVDVYIVSYDPTDPDGPVFALDSEDPPQPQHRQPAASGEGPEETSASTDQQPASEDYLTADEIAFVKVLMSFFRQNKDGGDYMLWGLKFIIRNFCQSEEGGLSEDLFNDDVFLSKTFDKACEICQIRFSTLRRNGDYFIFYVSGDQCEEQILAPLERLVRESEARNSGLPGAERQQPDRHGEASSESH
ncbi:MAG: hypothetical protein ABII23_09505 [bacterium]